VGINTEMLKTVIVYVRVYFQPISKCGENTCSNGQACDLSTLTCMFKGLLFCSHRTNV